jgi:hypothetical protein
MYSISICGDRPDFRVFIDLLHGAGSNVDTDGNSFPVNSRRWTQLYIADRSGDRIPVVIEAVDDQPNLFSVVSKSERLGELAATYLYLYCGDGMATSAGPLSATQIDALRDKFAEQLARAAAWIWHQSSDANPYPNLVSRPV